ncbi:MAG TPA: type II toxin-antitoxin system VapC family toxin [Ideonella sp.]|nr:type II toxin-antitoxin system VapC family toxin [Ideonella sp.]
MILLDTNVISELMLPQPAATVLAWIARQAPDQLATTTITIAELNAGIAVLPDGARRRDLQSRVELLIQQGLGPRVYGFDSAAAGLYGELFAARRRVGRPLIGLDLLIAAIARARGMALATRNTTDFEGCGLQLVNPWQTGMAQEA